MHYAQLNSDNTYSHQITTNNNVKWDETHFCPASKLTIEEAMFFRVVPLVETDPPIINPITQMVVRDGGEFVEGQWQYKWKIIELFNSQAEKNMAINQDQKAKDAEQAKSVRQSRDKKLAETDWRFRSDMTPSQAWKDYCQALRDIPTQAGFPWTVTYPEQP